MNPSNTNRSECGKPKVLSYEFDGVTIATVIKFKQKMPRSANWYDPVNDPVNDPVKLSKSAQVVLQEIKISNKKSRKELSMQTQLSDVTVKRAIKELKDKKVIERVGSDKTGHWEVLWRE